jgi:flagellar assembly factor FliW
MSTSAASALKNPTPTRVESHILGAMSVQPEDCFDFPDGILGFPACKKFALVPAERPHFFWLQSVECGSLAFLLVDPFPLVDEFYADLNEGDLLPLKGSRDSEIGVLAIVTLPKKPDEAPTANLQGLLAFNFNRRLARQVIVHDSPYGVQWPLDLKRLKVAS